MLFLEATYWRISTLILGTLLASAANAQAFPDVQLLRNGGPAAVGNYSFPVDSTTGQNQVLVLDNGLIRFTFSRDDAAGGIVTGWANTSITASSIIVNGVELAHNLNGVDPRDPDRQHSFYIDAGGGSTRLVCTQIKVLRNSADLAEVAFVDSTSVPLRHEHHLIMRRGKPGLYGYDIVTAATSTSISEIRNNLRWDRSIFDHSFNWERGSPDAPGTSVNGQQATYAYLATQTNIGDETWRIDGLNNPNLPSPDSNSGNLPADYVYSKYNWSLYHHENPMFGHFGHGFGAWLTPLGGVTDQTLAGYYGVGPNHQDLAIHQDALILNYFGANHYGLPGYSIAAGYRRLYGPWFTYVTSGDPNNSGAMIVQAANIAQQEIAENRAGSDWMDDPLYPKPAQRTTVTGHVQIADGRPADGLWVLLSTQNVTDVYTIHEPTYFVKTDADGSFSIPGVAAPLAAGTSTPSSYVLYVFSSKGSVTDQYKQAGITFAGPTQDLGTIEWTPSSRSTFFWQIGKADRMGGEFALATNPMDGSNPRAYEKPSRVPGTLAYTVGSSWEPQDWYYAQTNAGTWTVNFNLPRLYTGTAYLTVSSSLQAGSRPTVAVNGSSADITGSLPNNNDSTISRQADRSGYPRQATLSFPASRLVLGANTITFTRGAGSGSGNGIGWDTLVLEADETQPPPPAQLTGQLTGIAGTSTTNSITLRITNSGAGDANDVRLDSFTFPGAGGATPAITGRDPNRLPVPVIDRIAAGGTATVNVDLDFTKVPQSGFGALAPFSANGGRVRGTVAASVAPVIAGAVNVVTTSTLAKQTDGSYQAAVVITNMGSGTAQNVELFSASLGAAVGSPSPHMIGNIAPGGGQATINVIFPASAGVPGASSVEKLTGTYTGGSFGGSYRVTLPN